ncbi:MAG: hypothetical protein ACLU9S_22670 [Oscillospiraceae bacterium]
MDWSMDQTRYTRRMTAPPTPAACYDFLTPASPIGCHDSSSHIETCHQVEVVKPMPKTFLCKPQAENPVLSLLMEGDKVFKPSTLLACSGVFEMSELADEGDLNRLRGSRLRQPPVPVAGPGKPCAVGPGPAFAGASVSWAALAGMSPRPCALPWQMLER